MSSYGQISMYRNKNNVSPQDILAWPIASKIKHCKEVHSDYILFLTVLYFMAVASISLHDESKLDKQDETVGSVGCLRHTNLYTTFTHTPVKKTPN